MARIALAIAGAAAGFLIGGPAGASIGLSLGAVLGGVVDPTRTFGPRLNDLAVGSSANGLVVPVGYGLFRVSGNIIWSPGLVENTQNQSAKGGMSSTTYNYYACFAAAFGQGPGQVLRVWGDSKVIFETGGPTYYPSHYFAPGSDGYAGGICGAFVDINGNVIEAVWFGHGFTYTVPAGATALQLGINANYQALMSGGFPVTVQVSGGLPFNAYVPATAVPWEVLGTENAAYPFGNVGGTAPVSVLQNLSAGQSVTVSAVPDNNGTWGYQGRITLNASVGVNALGNSTDNKVQWYGPDGFTGGGNTGSEQTAPPASIYPVPNCYPGTETQEPDPGIQANEGVDSTPAFRGLVYAVWDDFPLANFGNRIPNIRAEVSFQSYVVPYTLPGTATQVQCAMAANGALWGPPTVTPTLGANPTPGNTLIFVGSCTHGAAFNPPAGITIAVHFTTSGGGSGSGAYTGLDLYAWTRPVMAGDGKAWEFVFTSPVDGEYYSAVPTFAVTEVLGSPLIDWTYGAPVVAGDNLSTGAVPGFAAGGALLYVSTSDVSETFGMVSPFAAWDGSHQGAAMFGVASGALTGGVLTVTAAHAPLLDCGYIVATMAANNLPVAGGGNTGLDAVVLDVCLRSGLTAAQVDVKQLAGQQVIGYVVGRLATAQQVLQPLALAYMFDAAEIDGVLTFVPRGKPSVMLIPECDLGLAEDKAEYTEEMGQEQDLPREITVTYADPALNYEQNKQARRRSAQVVKTRNQSILELPLALDTDLAAQIAEKALFLAYLERRPFTLNLWKATYNVLTPTDVVQFVGRGVTQQIRITKTSEGAGRVIALHAVSEEPSVYLSQATGGLNTTYAGGSQAAVVTVALYLFDVPLLRDMDANPAGTGYYFGMAAASGFAGGQLMTSTDNSTFSAEGPQVAAAMAYGTALTVLGDPVSPWALDTANTLTMQLISGALASTTLSQLTQDGANALLVGSEVIQFETAVQNTDGSWTVSGLLRGRRGTDNSCGSHGASETVVLLNTAGLVRVSEPDSILGVSRYYRALSSGQTLDAVTSQTFTLAGNDLKPWSPVSIGGSVDASGDWVISWLRRTRFGGAYGTGAEALVDGIGGPVNEQSEQYQIDILGGSPLTVKRTLTVGGPTAVYTAAMQTADFGGAQSALMVHVYQISSVVGRGFCGEGNLPASTDAPVSLPTGGAAGQFYIN